MAETETGRAGLRATLTRDHDRLEVLFEALLGALRIDPRGEALKLWAAFDEDLCRHMALEEQQILPVLELESPKEASALRREHEDIRATLTELGIGIDLHQIGADVVAKFVEQLRSHRRREDALAYRWAEGHLPAAEQRQIETRLGTTASSRRRAGDPGSKECRRAAPAR